MKKRLLFGALSALFAFSANAVEVGDYVYTPSGRYQLNALQSSIDLSFDEEFTGWTSISDDALLDNFTVTDGYVATSDGVTSANTKGLYKSFTVDDADKTYVLVFSAKAPESTRAYSFTPKFLGTAGDYISHLNVFATEDGNYVNTATAEATVAAQADLGLGFQLSDDYVTYATALTNGGSDLTWFIEMSQLFSGISVGQIQVYEATQVYDNRFIQNKIAYANAVINAYDWASVTMSDEEKALWESLKAAPETLANMSDDTTVEDGTAAVETVDATITSFCTTLMGDYTAENSMRIEDGGSVTKASTAIAGWATGQRWWHNSKASAIDDLYWGDYAYLYGNSNTITQTKTLAAGTYIFAVDAFMNAAAKKGTIINHSYGYFDGNTRVAVCRGRLVLSFVDAEGTSTAGDTIDLDDEVYQTGVATLTIPEGNDGDYTFTIKGIDTYEVDGVKLGGQGWLKNLRIYFKPAGKFNAAQLAYIEKIRTQISAMRTAYDASVSYSKDEEGKYYWYKQAVADTSAMYVDNLEFYEALTDDQIIEGFDDPASKAAKEAYEAETGTEVPDWDYNLSFAKYEAGTQNGQDTLTNRSVRPLLRLNERFLAANQHLFDLQAAIDNSEEALSDRVFQGKITYTTLQGEVTTAKETFEMLSVDPGDVETLVNDYIPAVDGQTSTLNETLTNFYEGDYNPGEEPVAINNFDFENGTFALDDETLDPGAATYTGADTDNGIMTFDNFGLAVNTSKSYNNGIWKDDAFQLPGYLRVGSGEAKVALDEVVSGTNALHVSFDWYMGNLTGNSNYKNGTCGLYLNDEEGNPVAGFYGCKYDNMYSYNPFGVNFATDCPGRGKGGFDVLSMVEEGNRMHWDIYIDYGEKSMFCIINNSEKKVVNKKYRAAIMENQNPVTTLLIKSNYDNSDRRGAVDNIVVEKIVLGQAVGINDAQAATVEAAKPSKRVVNGQIVIEKDGKFFDTVGKRIK